MSRPALHLGRESTPLLSVVSVDGSTETGFLINDIVREGARRMRAATFEAEVNVCIAQLASLSSGDFVSDGYRESADSWADLLRDCARRGMRSPVLAVGDGALGFWKVLAEVFPETRHKGAGFTRSPMLRTPAQRAVAAFAKTYGAKFPKAVKKITDDVDELPAFYDFTAEHWIHLRTTNPIESTFATVRLRTKVTRGAGSAAAALAMVFKLVQSAQQRWRAVNGTPPRRPAPCRSPLRARPPRRTLREPRGLNDRN